VRFFLFYIFYSKRILAYNRITMLSLLVFMFGTVLGSFLNVVILRFNTGKTLGGRSQCFSCGKTLSWYELLPVVSFFFLRGRCSRCKSGIAIQYPLVELTSGALTLFLFLKFFPAGIFESFFVLRSLFFIFSLLLWLSLLVVFVYDVRHKIIPDTFSVLFFVSATALTYLIAREAGDYHVFVNHAVSSLILGGFFFLLWFFSGGRAMGFGDVKLSLGIGMYLGIAVGLSAIAFAFWIGALYAVIRLLYQKLKVMGTGRLSSGGNTLTMKSEVPFAPFLIIGTLLAFILGSDVFHIAFFLNV